MSLTSATRGRIWVTRLVRRPRSTKIKIHEECKYSLIFAITRMKGSPNRPSRFVWGRALMRLRKEPQFRSPAARMQSNSLARYGGRQRLTLQRGGDSRQTNIDHLRAHEPGRQHGNTVLNKLLKTPRTGHKPTRANYPLHSTRSALSFSCPKWHAQFQRPHNMAERRVSCFVSGAILPLKLDKTHGVGRKMLGGQTRRPLSRRAPLACVRKTGAIQA